MKKTIKTYTEIFRTERKTFPQGCAVTRVIPDKRRKPRSTRGGRGTIKSHAFAGRPV